VPKRFIFRQIQFQDIAIFLKDGEIRAPNHPKPQNCHQASYSEIKTRRESIKLADGQHLNVNDYVQFYFSPITAFNFAICKGIKLTPPKTHPICLSKGNTNPQQRLFVVCDVDSFRSSALNYCFSNTALNTDSHLPQISRNLDELEQLIDWKSFDREPRVAKIPEIGYNGACKWFKDTPNYAMPNSDKPYQTMAEFLVETALPLSFVKCLVINPKATQRSKSWLESQLKLYNRAIPVYENAEAFFDFS